MATTNPNPEFTPYQATIFAELLDNHMDLNAADEAALHVFEGLLWQAARYGAGFKITFTPTGPAVW